MDRMNPPLEETPVARTSNVRHIVMIEDNPDNARLIQRVLAGSTYRLMHAWDGESGLKMALEYRPDIILLDLGLPDIDGQTLATFIRRAPELADTVLIAVTAWPEETAREMVRAYGCDGYISKPIQVRSFIEQMESFRAQGQPNEPG
jgi:two-component system cell cycle response regulator DivK